MNEIEVSGPHYPSLSHYLPKVLRSRRTQALLLLLAVLFAFLVGMEVGRGYLLSVRTVTLLCHDYGSTEVQFTSARPMCQPDDERSVLGLWSDGTTSVAYYREGRGWIGLVPTGGRPSYGSGHYVYRWQEIPDDMIRYNDTQAALRYLKDR